MKFPLHHHTLIHCGKCGREFQDGSRLAIQQAADEGVVQSLGDMMDMGKIVIAAVIVRERFEI